VASIPSRFRCGCARTRLFQMDPELTVPAAGGTAIGLAALSPTTSRGAIQRIASTRGIRLAGAYDPRRAEDGSAHRFLRGDETSAGLRIATRGSDRDRWGVGGAENRPLPPPLARHRSVRLALTVSVGQMTRRYACTLAR
jgi:hypothetical protein